MRVIYLSQFRLTHIINYLSKSYFPIPSTSTEESYMWKQASQITSKYFLLAELTFSKEQIQKFAWKIPLNQSQSHFFSSHLPLCACIFNIMLSISHFHSLTAAGELCSLQCHFLPYHPRAYISAMT